MSFHHSPKIVTDGLVFYVNPSSKKCIDKSFSGFTYNDKINDLTGKNRLLAPSVYFNFDDKSFQPYYSDARLAFYRDFTNVPGKVTYMCSFYLPPANVFNFGIDFPFIFSSTDGLNGFAIYFNASTTPNAYISMYVALNPYSTEVVSYPLAENNPSNFNKIYTVASTLDNGILKFYVNGQLTDSTYNLGVATAITQSQIEIGFSEQAFYDTNPYMRVYSSMIYNRALTGQEVLQNYNALKGRYKI
jgi:hypothetical protein